MAWDAARAGPPLRQQTGPMPTPEQLDDFRRGLVETCLIEVEEAQAKRVSRHLKLAFLFESDPERAAEIGAWMF